MRVVDPTFGHGGLTPIELPEGSQSGPRTGIALLSNAKPNASELLTGIGAYLAGVLGREPVLVAKDNPSRGADDQVLNGIARDAEYALVAIGD
jgi:thioredoxin reductase (NADPH)